MQISRTRKNLGSWGRDKNGTSSLYAVLFCFVVILPLYLRAWIKGVKIRRAVGRFAQRISPFKLESARSQVFDKPSFCINANQPSVSEFTTNIYPVTSHSLPPLPPVQPVKLDTREVYTKLFSFFLYRCLFMFLQFRKSDIIARSSAECPTPACRPLLQ